MLKAFFGIFSGAVSEAAKQDRPKPLPEFLPVIFANGEDDDTEGLVAFLEGRAVILPRGQKLEKGQPGIVMDVTIRMRFQLAITINKDEHHRIFGSPILDGHIPIKLARPNPKLMRSLYRVSAIIQKVGPQA